jgi:hypothetical protein
METIDINAHAHRAPSLLKHIDETFLMNRNYGAI